VGADSDTVTAIHRRVRALRAGLDPTAVARLRSGWLVMGDPQVLPGYCLLLPDPVVPHLNALSVAARAVFLEEMTAAGDVLLAAMGAVRINYAVFGNVEPALHAHLFPRCADEPVAKQSEQPWAWDWRLAPAYTPSVHGDLRRALAMRMIEQIPGACRTEGGC
jgi:diadenosine tetraphosphate (Ap4A) HIT family hydrolase